MSTIDRVTDSPEGGARTIENQELVKLIGECAQGEQKAFEALYNATSAQLYAVLKRMLRSEALAEEALQECYVKIWHNASDYQRDKSQPRTWLVSIARYHAIDTLRKRKVREGNEVLLSASDIHEFADEELPFNIQFEDSEQLTLCLNELTDSARQCVVDAYCFGYSQEELSQKLKKPLGTIKSWLRRSLLSLRECLHGYA